MPGGSVNGRPFREEASSYAATGVPRGNPSRVFHHGVMRMGNSMTGRLLAPDEKIETEGEKQLKALAKKQIATDITLEDHLKQKKEFTSGVIYKPLVQDVQGQLSLDDYEELAEKDKQIEELRQCGLTREEVDLKLFSQVPDKRRRLGADPAIQEMRISEIDAKISEKQHSLSKPDQFSGVKQLSRHEYDLEQSLLRAGNSNDKNVLSKFTRKKASKDHKLDFCRRNTDEGIVGNTASDHKSGKDNSGAHDISQTDFKSFVETELVVKFCLKCYRIFKSETNVKICEECVRNCCADSNEDGPATLCGPVRAISENVIKRDRLGIDEIRDIPRFKDYSPGVRNKTLFLKNLASGVTEFDLVSLFGRFQSQDGPKIVYRLMAGRMKGQAFVTLESEETAGAALALLNGYQLMGKPLVILYGKKTGTADKG
ncbi:RNA-binding protein 41-like [Lineus longissimus]|uniref:RNA-binding protein 41-like n=1 Tax=Lineus longissimus TaxID=88925 RepID=UPI002B4E4ECB